MPGTRNARSGAIRRTAASSAGAVAPTTSPTVPPGPQPGSSSGRPAHRAARRSPVADVGRDHESLELAGARVRCPTQHVREPVQPLQERFDRLRAEIRIDRDRVSPEGIEERHCLPGGRRSDVAALRVGDHGDVGRDGPAIRSSAAMPALPWASKNARFGFIAAANGARGLDDQAGEGLQARKGPREARGRLATSGSIPTQSTDPDRRGPGRDAVEIAGAPRSWRGGRQRRAGRRAARGGGVGAGVGSRSSGIHQPGRDAASRPAATVSANGSPLSAGAPATSSVASHRSVTPPSTVR